MGDFSIQQFEADGHENGVRFWYAHEFMKALGYDSWSSFQKVITRAMGSCAKLNIDPTEAFMPETLLENGKDIKTYKLSRFACFLVSMHADAKKEEVAKAKAALAAIADKLVEERITRKRSRTHRDSRRPEARGTDAGWRSESWRS